MLAALALAVLSFTPALAQESFPCSPGEPATKRLSFAEELVAAVSSTPEPVVCLATRTREDTLEVQLGKRKISLIGWTHPVEEEAARFKTGFNEALLTGFGGDCAGARGKLQATLDELSERRKSGRGALAALEAAFASHRFAKIGTEQTPEDQASYASDDQAVLQALAVYGKKCEASPDDILGASLIAPGPSVLFRERHSGAVSLAGLEDSRSRRASLAIVAKINAIPDLPDVEVPAGVNERIEHLKDRIDRWEPVSDQEIAELVASIDHPGVAKSVGEWLPLFRSLMEEAAKRDQVIADRLLAERDDYAVLIGENHVPDLAKRLVAGCREGRGLRAD